MELDTAVWLVLLGLVSGACGKLWLAYGKKDRELQACKDAHAAELERQLKEYRTHREEIEKAIKKENGDDEQ